MMRMACSSFGSPTVMGWKRRSSAESFSRCLRYSSMVVAPITWISPRDSGGFRMAAASMEPSAEPAPMMRVDLVDEEDDVARVHAPP